MLTLFLFLVFSQPVSAVSCCAHGVFDLPSVLTLFSSLTFSQFLVSYSVCGIFDLSSMLTFLKFFVFS
ncbi:hypothetical protein V8E55_002816 [Tylopilus felleus]